MSIAVLVAVEEYAAGGTGGVRFARNDAVRLSGALAAAGFDEAKQTLLVSGAATKAAVESALRSAIDSLGAGEAFCFYFVGHGFSRSARNFLTCYDSDPRELAATSIEVEWIFSLLRAASCEQVIFFLDSCHRGLNPHEESNGVLGGRSNGELRKFFDQGSHRVCFAPCLPSQVSWGSRRNQHGAWAFNVIEAFRGRAPGALADGTQLTARSLQGYLTSSVQQTLKGDFVERRDQTPWACGSVSDDLVLADFEESADAQHEVEAVGAVQVPRLSFCGKASQPFKQLSGFQKHQRVPSEVSRFAEAMARDASTEEIEKDLESVYRRLRDEFDLRRKDLEKVGPEDGGGSIVCPHFTYHVYVAQDPERPSQVLFHREISDISEPEMTLGGAFQDVFGPAFSSLKFAPPVQMDLEAFIDRMEGMGDDLQSLDFDPAGTQCSLRLRGVAGVFLVTAQEIVLVHDRSREPRVLLETFLESQRFLALSHEYRRSTLNRPAGG